MERCLIAALHLIETDVGRFKQRFNRGPIGWVDGNSHAHGNVRLCAIVRQQFADAVRDLLALFRAGFRENDGELIASVTGSRINRAAVAPQNIPQSLDGLAPYKMSKPVVDLLQSVE